MANVWHPIGGITITDLSEGRFLFRLYHKVYVNILEAGGPWNFNSHLLLMRNLQDRDDPKVIPLNSIDFWVLVKGLPYGFVSKTVAKQMGNFIGMFLEYYNKAVSLGYAGALRVRVRTKVEKPLKCKKCIVFPNGSTTYIKFAYEKLTLFCFLCNKLGREDSFFPYMFYRRSKS